MPGAHDGTLKSHFNAPQQQMACLDAFRTVRTIEEVFFKTAALRLRKLSEHIQRDPVSF
jgi:hypothetical protein